MNKEMLRIRNSLKKKKPHFVRQDQHKKKRLPDNWRRPRGSDSKMRVANKGYKRPIEIGWGSPKEAKGLMRNGLAAVIVHNKKEAEGIEPKTEGMLIGSDVGIRKRIEIITFAITKNITILNIKDAKKYVEEKLAELKARQEERKKRKGEKEQKKEKQEKKTPEKKAEEKPAETPEAEEHKKKEKEERDKVLTKPQ